METGNNISYQVKYSFSSLIFESLALLLFIIIVIFLMKVYIDSLCHCTLFINFIHNSQPMKTNAALTHRRK